MTVLDSLTNAHSMGPDTYRAEGWHAAVGRLLEELRQPTGAQGCGDIDQDTRDKLVRIFMSGFASGVGSLLVNGGHPGGVARLDPAAAARATQFAQRYATRIFDDPAVRSEVAHDLSHLWLGHGRGGVRVMEVHVAHPKGDQG